MDIAYDHIQDENFKEGEDKAKAAAKPELAEDHTLNEDIQGAYKAIQSSTWGSALGGIWASAKKQGEQYYSTAQQEYATRSTTASKGLNDLISRTRALSLTQPESAHAIVQDTGIASEIPAISEDDATVKSEESIEAHPSRPESLPADIYKEASKGATSLAARVRAEAAKRLMEAQKLEDAADDALLQWGTSIGNFFKEAITIAPPSSSELDAGSSEVLFASKDADGKRVVHATRLDAQLHVIHCSLDSFLHDPKSEEWEQWKNEFDVEKHTEEIAKDLDKYEKLRTAMEKCVPEKVEYKDFWCRYYFLRHVIETEESRRRELLKGATAPEEEVGWGDESDDEDTSTPKNGNSSSTTLPTQSKKKDDSDTATLKGDGGTLKVPEPRKSLDLTSTAGSDASYDMISGATSRAPGSPSEARKSEESDDEDWE